MILDHWTLWSLLDLACMSCGERVAHVFTFQALRDLVTGERLSTTRFLSYTQQCYPCSGLLEEP